MDPHDFCVLDVETAGGMWQNFPQGFDLLVTGLRYRHVYYVFTADPASLAQMAGFLDGFTGVVVTFNGSHFDLPLLDSYLVPLLGRPLQAAHRYDVAYEIERSAQLRISLDRVAQYTFGDQKLPWDHRLNRRIWKEQPHRLIEYNRRDVDLTNELYQRVLNSQHLFLGNATILLPLPGGAATAPWPVPGVQ